jgi:hypothetical protein
MEQVRARWQKDLGMFLGFWGISLLGVVVGQSLEASGMDGLRVWSYANAGLLLLGLPFLFLPETGLDRSGQRIFWRGMGWFVLTGILFALADVWMVYRPMAASIPPQTLPPFLQPFPYSILLYTSGAFEVEVFYRLIPLAIIGWMAARFNQGKWASAIRWTGILLTALREPLEQWPDGSISLVLYAFISGFVMNAIQAWSYFRYGIWASLWIRLGHYLIWHILLGIWVEWAN